MIKYIGKYYHGNMHLPFIIGFETVLYYDASFKRNLEAVVTYLINGTYNVGLKMNYNNENQVICIMEEQIRQIDYEALKKDKKALEEYEKYMFFLEHQEELNAKLKAQAKDFYGLEERFLPERFIDVNQLDSYTKEELQMILKGTYAEKCNARRALVKDE